MKKFSMVLSFTLLIVFVQLPLVHSSTNMLFILDASNSMWGQVDGVSKIQTAKTVFNSLLQDLPAQTKVGLMAYGLRSKDDCKDIEVLSKIGSEPVNSLISKVNGINPMGKTPIASSLELSPANFKGVEEENNHVVLISDGVETCEGDPCEAVLALKKQGIQMKFHVVGFDVSDEERKQLECIAQNGEGQYFQASSAQGLKNALVEVKKATQEPPKPVKTIYFNDDFDGEELAEHWEILTPNPDSFIVEDGQLLMVSGATGVFKDENIENIFKLSKPMPKGDWEMTVKFTIDFQTGYEVPFIALYQDNENYIEVQAAASGHNSSGTMVYGELHLVGNKVSKGKPKILKQRAWVWDETSAKSALFKDNIKKIGQPIILRLTKKGRSYFPALILAGKDEPKWIEPGKFTLLRSKGTLAFGLYQSNKTNSETTATIDWVKIETIQE